MNLDKFNAIVDGWKHVIFTDPKIEQMATQRAAICASCPSNNYNICGECGCPLIAKVRSIKETNDCPLKKWNEITINKS